jgi:thioredoxin reductase (NADPH)
MELMEKMKHHASKYVTFHFHEEVKKIEQSGNTFTIETGKGKYSVGAILLCTGTEHKTLEISGEEEFLGKGVSYCATCDGYFFKGKRVAIIGGGNTAVMEAIFLKQIGCKEVTLVHRRDLLKADKIYQDQAREKHVQILLNKTVEKIDGKKTVTSLQLIDIVSGKKFVLGVDGVFVSMISKGSGSFSSGVIPRSSLSVEIASVFGKISLDEVPAMTIEELIRGNKYGRNKRTNTRR